jgi:hypothetical protein
VIFLRGLAILVLVLAILIFMMPIVIGIILSIVLAVWIFKLLARLGFLPGFVFKTYRFPQGTEAWKDTESGDKGRAERVRESSGSQKPWPDAGESRSAANGWYQDDQEGEIITLPETALKRDDES